MATKKISDLHLFDKGWEKLREQIFATQKRLGVIPENTQLTPWPDGQPEFGGAKLQKWDSLSDDEKRLFTRQADVFAAYTASTDHEIGRVIQAIEDIGKLDNTLIIYISGDNGCSAEGSTLGTPNEMAAIQGVNIPVAEQLKFYDAWGSEAAKYNVFPLDNTFTARAVTPRPSATAGRTVFTFSGESSGLPYSSAPDIVGKSYSIAADIEIPQGGAEGMINTLGGRGGGHGLYVLKGKPVFVYNFFGLERFRWESQAALTPGKHTVVFDFQCASPAPGAGGTGVLSVDGKAVATKSIPHTIPFVETIYETFDVGIDTRTGVDDDDYQPPFRFNGSIDKLTITLIPPVRTAEEEEFIKQKTREAAFATQ